MKRHRYIGGDGAPALWSRRHLLALTTGAVTALTTGLLSACGSSAPSAVAHVASASGTAASSSAAATAAIRATSTTAPATTSSSRAATAASSRAATASSAAGGAGTHLIGHGGTSLQFLTGWAGNDGVTMQKMLSTYVADHPDISIDFQALPWNSMFAKLDTMLVAGTPPDLIAIHRTEIPEYGSRGSLQSIGTWFGEKSLPKSDFGRTVLDGVTWEGKMVAVPLDLLNYNTYVNTAPLRRAGLDDSKMPSGQDFLAQARHLSHDQSDPQKASFALDGFGRNGVLALLYQYDADFLSPDGKQVTINAPQAVDALQAFNDLIYKEQVYPPPSLKLNAATLIKDDRLAYRADGDWDLNFYVDNGLQPPAFAALPFPQLGPKPVVWINSHVMALPVGTKDAKADAARELITWISDQGLDWAHAGHVPARLSQQHSPELQQDWAWSVRVFAQAAQSHGRYEVATPRQTDLRTFEDKVVAEIQQNSRPIKAILDDYAGQIKGMLARG